MRKNAAKVFVALFITVISTGMYAQSVDQRLVGTWIDVMDNYNVWVFNADGTGSWRDDAFKYEAIAGKLAIFADGNLIITDFVISNDGKTLIWAGGGGHGYLLKKKT